MRCLTAGGMGHLYQGSCQEEVFCLSAPSIDVENNFFMTGSNSEQQIPGEHSSAHDTKNPALKGSGLDDLEGGFFPIEKNRKIYPFVGINL